MENNQFLKSLQLDGISLKRKNTPKTLEILYRAIKTYQLL